LSNYGKAIWASNLQVNLILVSKFPTHCPIEVKRSATNNQLSATGRSKINIF